MEGGLSEEVTLTPGGLRISVRDILAIAELAAISERDRCWNLGQIDSEAVCAEAFSGIRRLRRHYEEASLPKVSPAMDERNDVCQCGIGDARPVFHAAWCEIRLDWSD